MVISFFLAPNGIVRDEPSIASASKVLFVTESANVGLILERHADRESVQRNFTCLREMKNELVCLIYESVAVHRIEWPVRLIPHSDTLVPNEFVLEPEPGVERLLKDFPWNVRFLCCAAHLEKEVSIIG